MFSLQRLLGKDDKFFTLLEAGAAEARHSVEALVRLLALPHGERTLDEFVLRRSEEKRIAETISAELCRTFVTPLEREDIEALSSGLYKIPRTIEKFGERILLSHALLNGADFSRQTRLLEQMIDVVSAMVVQLRGHAKLERVKEQNERLKHFEQQADKLMLELLRDLYSGNYEALRVIALRDLHELLERVIDRCRDCGNIIFHIVLKNS